jgi:hypothetical protein
MQALLSPQKNQSDVFCQNKCCSGAQGKFFLNVHSQT